MKQIEKRKRLIRFLIACCVMIGLTAPASAVCYAETPTLDSQFKTLVVGTNDLKVEYYDGSQTMAGCFTAPEKGNYSFYVVNTGELSQAVYLLDDNFAQFNSYPYGLKTTKQYTFGTYLLEKGEKIYFYALRASTSYIGTLASRFVITKESENKSSDVQVNYTSSTTSSNKNTGSGTASKSKIAISKSACSLKKGKSLKLKLKNSRKKVLWVSREKKIASVTTKGVVKGKKKGITYIYAIANHKLYKCKVKVY